MNTRTAVAPVRILPEDVANKIAAGEVVERPSSVVKELVENAIDAKASRIIVRLVGAGRRTIEVIDNGHGMSDQDALLAIERHATSKIRKAEDLDNILTMGFRGEALASIAAVSRFEMLTRREESAAATRIRIEGGILRDTGQVAGPVGTRISVNRLYFNTPARAKFLKGVTTELSHCIDIVQRHALSHVGVAFQLLHNEKSLLDIPENATLRERIALIWGLGFAKDLVEIDEERGGLRIQGLIASPQLSRSARSHQFLFMNKRPIVNRSLQYGFEDAYRGLLTVGRYPVCVLLLSTHPRFVDINIHPAKREIRFRDERAARDAIRDMVRERLASIPASAPAAMAVGHSRNENFVDSTWEPDATAKLNEIVEEVVEIEKPDLEQPEMRGEIIRVPFRINQPQGQPPQPMPPVQTEFSGEGKPELAEALKPAAMYSPLEEDRAIATARQSETFQVFDAYLIVPEMDRLLIIDQHALHERLTYDTLMAELREHDYEAQQLAVPVLIDVPPSHTRLLENNVELFKRIGIEIEPFGGNTFQVVSICHQYEESRVADAVYRVLDMLAQGDLFSREDFMADLLRMTVQACRASVKAGDRLSPEERQGLIEGFRRMRPPYTCPHGRPIITELTLVQMEKSFRRRQ
jgi:DNA mismatch repair protein MutL